jgi:hypothetical protein
MNQNEEVPDFLGGHGDLLPADVLKMVNFFNEPDEQSGTCSDSAMARKSRMKFNELLEQLHRKEKDHQGSTVINIYGKGSLHVDHVDTQNFYGDACPQTKTLPSPPCVGREKESSILPKVLATDEAMALWRKAQDAGYVDDNYQPLISRTQAALLADAIAVRLGIKEKWKVFESLWNRKYMRSDYNLALTRKRSLDFQDELKRLFG